MTNSSSSFNCGLYSNESVVVQIIAHVVTCLFALSGNFLIIASNVQKRSDARTIVDGLITNMAVSDLLVPIMIIPREIHDAISGSKVWIVEGLFGEILCRLINCLGDIVSEVSILSLCFMAIERFVMVAIFGNRNPIQQVNYTQRKRLNQVFIALSWIIPMIFNFHFFFTFKLYRNPLSNQTFCIGPVLPAIKDYYIYNAVTCVVFIFLPFVILLTFNTALVMKLRRMLNSLPSTDTNASREEYRKRLQKQRRIKNLMVAITLAFGLCWGPLYLLTILFTFYWNLVLPRICSFDIFRFISIFMARANSAINPWIYIGFQKKRTVRFRSFPLRARVSPQVDAG